MSLFVGKSIYHSQFYDSVFWPYHKRHANFFGEQISLNNTFSLFDSPAFAAFLGAFSAFAFGLIAYRYDKKRTRIIKHQNAAVELGYLLNEQLDDIGRNRYLVAGTLQIFKKNLNTYNHFSALRRIEDMELRLGDLDLINRSSTHQNSVIRINSDLNSLNRVIDLLNTAQINKSLSKNDLRKNLKNLSEQLTIVDRVLELTYKKTKDLYAYVRVYQNKTFNKWVIRYWENIEKERLGITSGDIESELKVLEEEIKENEKDSKKEIEELLGVKVK